jgi:hypothetical protein
MADREQRHAGEQDVGCLHEGEVFRAEDREPQVRERRRLERGLHGEETKAVLEERTSERLVQVDRVEVGGRGDRRPQQPILDRQADGEHAMG